MTVRITDSFEIRPGMPGTDHEPGLVIVFDGSDCAQQVPGPGLQVRLAEPGGRVVEATVTEVKRHGRGVSFFLPRLTRADVPVGSEVSWGRAPVGSATRGV